jgi:clan AA aspartic protease
MTIRPVRTKGTQMGLTYITATVRPVESVGSPVTTRFLIDTGAIDCLLPASVLRQAGVEPDRSEFYELAGGRLMEFPVAYARIEFMDRVVLAEIIFGPEDSEPLMGAIALETAGLTVDPSSQTLRRRVARSLKKACAMSSHVVSPR